MPVKRPKKGSSATLLKSPQENPEPGINELQSETGHECNRIPVLLHSVPRRPPLKFYPCLDPRAGTLIAFLTEAEIERLLAVITNPRDRAIFSIAYHRGLRASEIGMLEMRDYTPPTINQRTLYCRRLKDSFSKIFDLTKGEEKELRAWLRIRGRQPGPLFPSRQNGPISRTVLHKLMRKCGAAAGIPPALCHVHTLKHTCAVAFAAAGNGRGPGAELAGAPEHPIHDDLSACRGYQAEGCG